MEASWSGDVVDLLGEDGLKGSSLVVSEGDEVNFLVSNKKQRNFSRYCGRLEPVKDPVGVINQYTDHTTRLFAKVNLCLASDSDGMSQFGDFIPQLRSAIFSQPLLDNGVFFRGVSLSSMEIAKMEELQTFFIPSFTSTSVDPAKAYAKSATMVIKVPFGCQYACSITEKLSKFHEQEREVLLACYSAFRLERIEQGPSNTKIISLYLDEHLSAHSSLA